MDLTVEQFIDGLFSKQATETPPDKVKPEEITLKLPDWYDEKKFNDGRRFFWDFGFAFSSSMLLGLVAVLAIPSILRVLVATYRSSTKYTAYKRYASTFIHTISWFEHEMKPGSPSWQSLELVRNRHLRASLASKLKGNGIISQRDMALTQFGFIGFSILNPDKYGIYQLNEGDWEGYNHVWRVIGHLIGIEDRFNICRQTMEETREVCRILQDRVFIQCMDNVPEYYEHMARVLLDGLGVMIPTDTEAALYYCKYLGKVPGYIYTEEERIDLHRRIAEELKGKSTDSGVDSATIMQKCLIEEELTPRPPRLLYLRDYTTFADSPAYNDLSWFSKFRLHSTLMMLKLYPSHLGRMIYNWIFIFTLTMWKYFPVMAFFAFGYKEAFVNIFAEDPMDYSRPKLNSEYFKKKSDSSLPRYLSWLPLEYVPYLNYFLDYKSS